MTAEAPAIRGIILCDDLIFVSKVTATSRALGIPVTSARSVAVLLDAARKQPPTGVILDLHNPGLNVPELLRELQELGPIPPRVVGFGSHVDVATLKAAREAGCHRVMPRSQFVKELETHLPEWLTQAREA